MHKKLVVYDKAPLCIFRKGTKLRFCIVWFIESKFFEYFIFSTIILNSVLLAMYDYGDRDATTMWNQTIDKFQLAFTFIFTFEAMLKIAGMGFVVHPRAYLRDAWNILDFLVVVVGIIEVIPSIPSLKALRTFRVLRPLKSINAVPSMRRLVSSLIMSLPYLGNVTIFLLFIFLMFGIMGVQQFRGYFYYRCLTHVPTANDTVWPLSPSHTDLCSPEDYQGRSHCSAPEICMSPQMAGWSLQQAGVYNWAEINYAITTFDNIGPAILTIFQVITLDSWTKVMYNMMDSNNSSFSATFFCFLVLLGSFFLLNLILAVIMDAFNKEDEKWRSHTEEDLKNQDMKKLISESEVSKVSSSFASEINITDE